MARPKSNTPPISATERVNKSINALVASGGKRLMLRLTPEGYDALKTIIALENYRAETKAINDTLIERKRFLLGMSTK